MSNLNTLRWLWREIDIRKEQWLIHVNTFGRAYATAYQSHHDWVKQQQKADALTYDVAFSMLGLVTWGTTKWLGNLVKTRSGEQVKEWVFEPVVQVSRTVAGFEGKAMKARGLAPEPVIGTSPFVFSLDLEKAVRQQVVAAREWLQESITELERQPANWVEDHSVNPQLVQQIQCLPFFTTPPEFDPLQMEQELERLLWARWVQKLLIPAHTETFYSYKMGGEYQRRVPDDYISPGGKIEDRLRELGVRIGGQPLDFGLITFDSEVRSLIEWGRNYQPRLTFGSPLHCPSDYDITPANYSD